MAVVAAARGLGWAAAGRDTVVVERGWLVVVERGQVAVVVRGWV